MCVKRVAALTHTLTRWQRTLTCFPLHAARRVPSELKDTSMTGPRVTWIDDSTTRPRLGDLAS